MFPRLKNPVNHLILINSKYAAHAAETQHRLPKYKVQPRFQQVKKMTDYLQMGQQVVAHQDGWFYNSKKDTAIILDDGSPRIFGGYKLLFETGRVTKETEDSIHSLVFHVGQQVIATWHGDSYVATIMAINNGGTYTLRFSDGDVDDSALLSSIDSIVLPAGLRVRAKCGTNFREIEATIISVNEDATYVVKYGKCEYDDQVTLSNIHSLI